jgi:hypothetical protein
MEIDAQRGEQDRQGTHWLALAVPYCVRDALQLGATLCSTVTLMPRSAPAVMNSPLIVTACPCAPPG